MIARLRLYFEFARPFTLLLPLAGMLSGSATAWGGSGDVDLLPVLMGGAMAVFLNAASNALNQICDLGIDRIAKPGRPLPSGRMGIREAWAFTAVTWGAALALAFFVGWECFGIVLAASVFIWIYSAPPLRARRRGWLANLTIAIPRGVLLKAAGWSAVRSVLDPEPWFLGAIFGLFLLGASSTKDFADVEGDRADGCRTLPIRYGAKGAAWRIAPFLVLPFLLLPIGARLGVLTGDRLGLDLLGGALAAWGSYVCWLMLRRPETLSTDSNHVSWRHMVLMTLFAQAGLAAAYLI